MAVLLSTTLYFQPGQSNRTRSLWQVRAIPWAGSAVFSLGSMFLLELSGVMFRMGGGKWTPRGLTRDLILAGQMLCH